LADDRSAMASPPGTIQRTEHGFRARSSVRVTFGPSPGSPAATVRSALRQELAALSIRDGHRLHAVFRGAIPPNSDLENQLLYNVLDGASTAALSHGVRFELHDAELSPDFTYIYESIDAGQPFAYWRAGPPIASWNGIALPAGSGDLLLARTWRALHDEGSVSVGANTQVRGRFGVRLDVALPTSVPRLTPEHLKRLLDGAISALQAHGASATAVDRVAAALDFEHAAVASRLANRGQAALGAAVAPVGLTRTGVQWNPDDTRLVAADISVARSQGPAWVISGRAFSVSAE
jgi:hypothetical protein